ncbi:MAG TPA: hypothetical protein VGQ38_12355 [Gaiellaceae bacterium]|nr:hypothetical protein [Gaiellaceae bacterium]
MPRYLISFDEGAMTFPEEDLPAVAEAAHAMVDEAMEAGVFVFGGGLNSHDEMSAVATDGTVTDAPHTADRAYIGGFWIVDVPSREGGAGVGCQDRRRLPLCPGRPRVHARPGSRQLIEARGYPVPDGRAAHDLCV